MNWLRTVLPIGTCHSATGILCAIALLATAGCDVVIRNESDANVRRLAENWPPYQAPVVSDPIAKVRSLATPAEERPVARNPPRTFVPLIPIRRAEEWDLPETAMDSLGRIGAPAVPALIDALDHDDPTRREQAARVLARIGPEAKQSVTALVGALKDDSASVRKAAARALGQIGPEAEDAVIPLLQLIEEEPTQEPVQRRDPGL